MIHVTHHAVQRYQERVRNVPEAEVRAILSGKAFQAAATFGARCVILPRGQRAVIHGATVVTILCARRRRHQAARIAINTTWEDETA